MQEEVSGLVMPLRSSRGVSSSIRADFAGRCGRSFTFSRRTTHLAASPVFPLTSAHGQRKRPGVRCRR